MDYKAAFRQKYEEYILDNLGKSPSEIRIVFYGNELQICGGAS